MWEGQGWTRKLNFSSRLNCSWHVLYVVWYVPAACGGCENWAPKNKKIPHQPKCMSTSAAWAEFIMQPNNLVAHSVVISTHDETVILGVKNLWNRTPDSHSSAVLWAFTSKRFSFCEAVGCSWWGVDHATYRYCYAAHFLRRKSFSSMQPQTGSKFWRHDVRPRGRCGAPCPLWRTSDSIVCTCIFSEIRVYSAM